MKIYYTSFHSNLLDLQRTARARKMVAKLGEKLQTVRQCQQISGCPFTFKQLRASIKLKTGPSVSLNIRPLTTGSALSSTATSSSSLSSSPPKPKPNEDSDPLPPVPPVKYTYNTNSYRPLQKARPKPASTELSLGDPVIDTEKDTHKGNDDELEEFFGPPPVFGSNGRPISQPKPSYLRPQNPLQQQQQQIQKLQSVDVEYVPYQPPITRGTGSKAKVQSGSPFPKRKQVVGYKTPTFQIKRRPEGENDEFDDVNLSAGPVSLIGGDQQQQQQQFEHAGVQYIIQDTQENVKQQQQKPKETDTEDDDDGSDEEDDEDAEDEEDEDADADDVDEKDEEDDDEDEEDKDEEEKETKKKKATVAPTVSAAEVISAPKKKITSYKNPSAESFVVIEEEFPTKKNAEDDEQDHPDNAWTKLAFATSSALIKEPKNKKKTELEEKNDEKLNLSTEKKGSSEKEDTSDESKEEEEEDDQEEEDEEEEGEKSSRSQPKPEDEKKTKDKVESQDDSAEEEKSRNRRPSKKSKKNNNTPKLILNDENEFDRVTSTLSRPVTSKPKKSTKKSSNKGRDSSKSSKKSGDKKKKSKKSKKSKKPKENSEEEVRTKPKAQPLLEIGGRPVVPLPEKESQQTKKTGALSRFKFSLVRPFGVQTKEEAAANAYQQTTKSDYKPSLPTYSSSPSSSSFKKPSSSSPSSSFRRESLFGSSKPSSAQDDHKQQSHSSSYLPTISFGSGISNMKIGNSHANPSSGSSSSKTPAMYTFPFGSPFSTLKTLFKRPSSSSSQDEDMGHQNAPLVPISAYMHRPAGPESNNFKRGTPPHIAQGSDEVVTSHQNSRNRGRTGIKSSKKKDGGKKKKNYKVKQSKPSVSSH